MCALRSSPEAASDGDLRPAGADARPRQAAGIDLVADDHIEAELWRGGAIGAGEAMVEQRLCIAHGEQDMLLGRNIAEVRVVHRPAEGDMRMAFHQPGQQGLAAGLDDRGALGRELAGRLAMVRIRLPSTSTSAGKASAPLPSHTFAPRKRIGFITFASFRT